MSYITPIYGFTSSTLFRNIEIGTYFVFNDCLWAKKSSRTALGIWPACLPEWSYFKQTEAVKLFNVLNS